MTTTDKFESITDDRGACLKCGHRLDADAAGHADDCPWGE